LKKNGTAKPAQLTSGEILERVTTKTGDLLAGMEKDPAMLDMHCSEIPMGMRFAILSYPHGNVSGLSLITREITPIL